MPELTSPKKLYKRMIPILVKSHLYMLNTDYVNDNWYGNWYGKNIWKLHIDVDYATLQYKQCILKAKWIWRNNGKYP